MLAGPLVELLLVEGEADHELAPGRDGRRRRRQVGLGGPTALLVAARLHLAEGVGQGGVEPWKGGTSSSSAIISWTAP